MFLSNGLSGDKVLAVSSSQQIAIQADIVTAGFSLVKDRVSNFVENSKMLVGVLDEVGKTYPFIQGRFSALHFADKIA
jgi:hypothetical protein